MYKLALGLVVGLWVGAAVMVVGKPAECIKGERYSSWLRSWDI